MSILAMDTHVSSGTHRTALDVAVTPRLSADSVALYFGNNAHGLPLPWS